MNASTCQAVRSVRMGRTARPCGRRIVGHVGRIIAWASVISGSVWAAGFDEGAVVDGYVVNDGDSMPSGDDAVVDASTGIASGVVAAVPADPFPVPTDVRGIVATDGTPCGCPHWTAQVDALMLWEGPIASRPLFVDSTSGLTALDANQLQPAMTVAPRYALMYHRDACRAIEVNYFELWGFDATRTLPTIANGYTSSDLAGLDPYQVDSATATASGHIKSFEGNLRRSNGDQGSIRWLTGFRWVEWGQQLGIVDAAGAASDAFDVRTLNNLYGWQWGADAMLWNNGGPIRVNGVGKAGVYYNHRAVQNTTYSDGVNPPTTVSAVDDTVSFFGEVGLNGSVAITHWLSWRAGYSVFWLTGVAVPASQLSVTNINGDTSINTNGSVLLHGVTTGLEARW